MAGPENLRDEVVAALCDAAFVSMASRLRLALLRHAVSARLADEAVGVVVVFVEDLGPEQNCRTIEVVWQPEEGGELERTRIEWEMAPAAGVPIQPTSP